MCIRDSFLLSYLKTLSVGPVGVSNSRHSPVHKWATGARCKPLVIISHWAATYPLYACTTGLIGGARLIGVCDATREKQEGCENWNWNFFSLLPPRLSLALRKKRLFQQLRSVVGNTCNLCDLRLVSLPILFFCEPTKVFRCEEGVTESVLMPHFIHR